VLCAVCVKMKPDHERVTKLLTDTVTLLCKNGLSYDHELRIQGLLGITVDNSEVFLVSINDSFDGSSSTSSNTTASDSPPAGSSQSRKRSRNDIIDLTRLVETPAVCTGMQLPSSISPMYHGTPTRPKSAGSVSQSRSSAVMHSSPNLSMSPHSQPVARQPPFPTLVTSGYHNTSAGCRNSSEHPTPASSQHRNTSASVESSAVHLQQRPYAGYGDSIHNLMLACERQLDPRCYPRVQHHRQLPPAGASCWPGTEQQHSMQHRQIHQNMIAGGRMLSTGQDDLAVVARPRSEYSMPQRCRQPMVPVMPGNTDIHRSDVAVSLHHLHTGGDIPSAGPPPTLSRQCPPGAQRLAFHDYSQHFGNVWQAHAAAEARHVVNSAACFQLPTNRRAPNHLPRQAVQSLNPACVRSRVPRPQGRFTRSDSTILSQQTCTISRPPALYPLPSSIVPESESSPATSSPVIKPPSSPVQSGRRSRSRHVEHIDLRDDDETADNGAQIPVSSIVIQPENTDFYTMTDEAEMSNIVFSDVSDSCISEFETAAETIISENDLPSPSHIREIVPLDDGLDNEGDEVVSIMQNGAVVADDAGQSASVSFSVSSVPGRQPAVDEQNVAPDHFIHLHSELSAAQPDISTFPHDLQLSRLSADESRQMAELYFDTGQ